MKKTNAVPRVTNPTVLRSMRLEEKRHIEKALVKIVEKEKEGTQNGIICLLFFF